MRFTTRAAAMSDAAAIAELLTRCRRRHLGRDSSLAEAIEHLSEPGTDPRLDSAVATSSDGRMLGFGHIWPAGDEIKCFARVDPDATGRGIGTALLERLERRAGDLAEPGTELTLTQWAADAAALPLLRARGYVERRFFLRMVVDLAADLVEVPPVPAGIELRTFEAGDEDGLYAAFRDAFASHPGRMEAPTAWWEERREHESAGFDATLWLLALDAGSVVGFSLGRERVDDGAPSGYIGDVGVRPAWQGRGLGHALLARSLAEFRRRGLASASLDVDAENTSGALALYRKVGMRPEPAFTIWAKPLG
jgi:mycothiol synthase